MKAILIFDENVGTGTVYSLPEFNRFLGMYDKYSFHIVCSASSSAGTVTVDMEHGSDERNWASKYAAGNEGTCTTNTTAQTSGLGTDLGTTVSQGFGRIGVSNSAGICRVKVWATGRNA